MSRESGQDEAATREGLDRTPLRPDWMAARLSLAYMVLCFIYIILSSKAVSTLTVEVERLEAMEMGKGLAFIVITGLLFYVLSRRALLQIQQKEAEILSHRQALVASERRATAGILASAIAHDINNVLTVAKANAAELAAVAKGPPLEAHHHDLNAALDEIATMARRLSTAGKDGSETERIPFNLLSVTHRAVDYVHHLPSAKSCKISVTGDSGITVRGSPRVVGQMVLNLLLNAADATEGKGTIEVRIKRHDKSTALLEVHDNGPGVDPAVKDTIFTPFVTTKKNGTGLGLLSARAAAQQHAGDVLADKSHLGGACFRVTMAAVESP